MLEFNRQLPAQGTAALGEAAVLEGNPLLAAGELPEQALAGFAMPEPELFDLQVLDLGVPEPLAAERVEAPAQEAPQEVAEQWLIGMLGQQALQVEARDPQQATQMQTPAPAAISGAVRTLQLSQDSAQDGDVLQLPAQWQAAAAKGQSDPGLPSAAADAEWTPQPAPGVAALDTRQAAPALAATLGALTPSTTAAAPETAGAGALEAPTSVGVNGPATLAAAPVAQRPALQSAQARLGEQMLQTLRDSVETQVRQGVQQTSIRLDPPELGSMEIFVSHDSGRLHVQISASNLDVARLLQQTSDRLRQELVGSNFLQVNVQVGSEGHSGRQQGRQAPPWQDPEVRAAQRLSESAADERAPSDVLITV